MKTKFGAINHALLALHAYPVETPVLVKLNVLAKLLRSMSAQSDAIALALKGLRQGTQEFADKYTEVMDAETDYEAPDGIKAPLNDALTVAQLMALQDLGILGDK